MKKSLLFCGLLAGLCGAILVTAQDENEDEGRILIDNKCQCVRVTSRLVPSPDNPGEKVVERNIRLICKKCDPIEVELDNEVVAASQSNQCGEDSETCYTYDRNKCYTSTAPLYLEGQTRMVTTALTPESCYAD
uniref:Joining chain of multimeric IgA and IgM n=1 Tax=Vombatus ursinus TaxID=29139 RepID=A0A4X2KIT0_VOMUR